MVSGERLYQEILRREATIVNHKRNREIARRIGNWGLVDYYNKEILRLEKILRKKIIKLNPKQYQRRKERDERERMLKNFGSSSRIVVIPRKVMQELRKDPEFIITQQELKKKIFGSNPKIKIIKVKKFNACGDGSSTPKGATAVTEARSPLR